MNLLPLACILQETLNDPTADKLQHAEYKLATEEDKVAREWGRLIACLGLVKDFGEVELTCQAFICMYTLDMVHIGMVCVTTS